MVSWIALLIMLVGVAPWAPNAMAQDSTPATEETIEVVVTDEPEVVPTDEVNAPESQNQQQPASIQQESDESLPGEIVVTGISLECPVATDNVTGRLTIADPGAPGTVVLTLRTTDDPAIPDLQSISVPVNAGVTSYTFTAILESGDYELSTTREAVVVGPGGVPSSLPFDLALVNGLTVCQPEGTEPEPSATTTETATVTETATATATGSATATTTATPPMVSTGKVINTGGANLNCRAAASTSAAIIAKLPPNSTISVRGPASNGWVPVTCAGRDGFVSGAYLQVTTAPATVTPTATSTATATATATATTTPGTGSQTATVANTGGAGLRCRTAANTNSTIITVLPEGTNLPTRGASSNGWVPVTCGGRDGFVSASYVRLSSGTPATPTATATTTATTTPTTPSTGQKAYITGTGGAGLRCRTAPVSGGVITVIPENTQITIETESNGWARIQCAGQTGWVSMTYVLFTVNPGTGGGALRIDVNLRTQYMIVYQGNNVLGRTYVSTGRPGFDTPTGTYYINRKIKVQDMSGVLGGEYYHVRNVPDVMYFTNRGHAIHGAYWHNNFGYVMSHGCVNLPLGFATWLYNITPVGTKVTIHY